MLDEASLELFESQSHLLDAESLAALQKQRQLLEWQQGSLGDEAGTLAVAASLERQDSAGSGNEPMEVRWAWDTACRSSAARCGGQAVQAAHGRTCGSLRAGHEQAGLGGAPQRRAAHAHRCRFAQPTHAPRPGPCFWPSPASSAATPSAS